MVPYDDLIRILLVLVLLSAAVIIARRELLSLISLYAGQSFLIVCMAFVLFFRDGNRVILTLAVVTVFSKVIIIPWLIRRVQRRLRIKRDVEFKYLSPTGAIFLSGLVFFMVYASFSDTLSDLGGKLFSLAASLSIALVFMGLIILFTRRQTITNVIGYLTMENGVLLFSLFVTELPLVIEVIILLDLIVLILLVTLLAFGIDSSMEEFHERLNPFGKLFGDEPR